MRRLPALGGALALALALAALAPPARAHPLEPVVTGSPMPLARDTFELESGYDALHAAGGVEQGVPVGFGAGVGGLAELDLSIALDATEGAVGPVEAGAKLLLLMEDARGIDLALAAGFASDASVRGALLGGRSLLPGFYLQAAAGVRGRSQPAPAPTLPTARFPGARGPRPRHGGGLALLPDSGDVIFTSSAALQWAPHPRLLPTLEAVFAHAWDGPDGANTVALVPEIVALLEINHLAVKLAVPVGLAGATDVGLMARLEWQR